jgi:cobalt/nickel transport system permease protein
MHHIQGLFARGSATRGRLWDACDVRVRFVVGLTAVVAVVMSTRLWFGLAALVCCLIVATATRAPFTVLARRLVGPLLLAIFIGLVRAFSSGSTPLCSVDLGPWRLTAYGEGLRDGLLIACRVLGSFGIVMVLCQGTPALEIFAAMRWAKVPRTWLEVAILMYRYLYVLFEQAMSVTAAQKVRLGYATWRRSVHSLGNLAGIVILRSLDQTEKSHEAMVARGYQGRLPLPSLPPLPALQKAAAVVGVALVATAFLLAERCAQ